MFQLPQTPDEWRAVARGFEQRWQFPNCLGALDGKHCAIRCPAKAGSLYFNYKHFHSVILLGLVDSNYCFLYVDVGRNGRYVSSVMLQCAIFVSTVE